MSKFSFPSDFGLEEMTRIYSVTTSWAPDGGNPARLMVQAAGATAIANSFAIGMASQMAGTMYGLFNAMNKASVKAVHGSVSVFGAGDAGDRAPVPPQSLLTARSPTISSANHSTVEKLKADAEQVAQATREINAGMQPETTTQIAILEPEDFRRPKEIEKPAQPDDLKLISGIGPKLEQVLNSLGVWTFAQVAGWSPNEIAWIDDYLQFRGRIDRDNWLVQAAALAAGGREEQQGVHGSKPR